MNTEFAFFKCISTSEKMVIPPAVVSQWQQVFTNTVLILRDIYHNLWTVGVHKNGDEWSFNDGWPQFYKDNSLEPGHFMVFDYKGTNLFDFKLLGANACQTKGVGGARFFQEADMVDEEEEEEEDEDDDDFYMEEDRVKKDTKSKNHESKSSSRIDECGTQINRGKQSNKKKFVSRCYGSDIFNEGLASRPKNPFFVLRSRTSRKNELFIPKNVIVDYKLDITDKMKMYLVDESGNRWETRAKRWGDKRMLCTGGWKSLCNVNNIDKDDTCICEFVKDDDEEEEGRNTLCLLVRVVHRPGPSPI